MIFLVSEDTCARYSLMGSYSSAVVISATPVVLTRVVKLPVIYVGGKLPVTYRPLVARLGHLALVLKGVGQSVGLNIFLAISLLLHSKHFLDMKFATLVCNKYRFVVWKLLHFA